ncbi:MAG: hypothetical protein KBC23_07525, partial [Candidatus Omnitrophica bacterium]|nr:hypothetical protein [Candidatus Omnitrophota bacterium]
MNPDKFFQTAVVISALAHVSFIAVNLPSLNFLRLKKSKQEIKVVYIKNPQQPVLRPQKKAAREPLVTRIPAKVTADSKSLLAPLRKSTDFIKRSSGFAAKEPAIVKPFTLKPDIIPIKKKITLPPVETTKMNNPSYISYYQLVREKIRRSAYQNYSRTETGDIFLSFVIAQNGSLRDIRLIEEKSTPSYYLRDIAAR